MNTMIAFLLMLVIYLAGVLTGMVIAHLDRYDRDREDDDDHWPR